MTSSYLISLLIKSWKGICGPQCYGLLYAALGVTLGYGVEMVLVLKSRIVAKFSARSPGKFGRKSLASSVQCF